MLGAIGAGLGIAKSLGLFGKPKQPQQGMASPFMQDDELRRYQALRDLLKKVKSPYMASLMGRNEGMY